jgi:hypothetical protein
VLTVELCNDYSLWPHSSLSITGLAGTPHPSSLAYIILLLSESPFMSTAPTKPRHLNEQQSQSTWAISARAYSAALITALREDCEQERRAHSESLRRIAELEAQLARREVELEEPYCDSIPATIPLVDPPLPQLSPDGAIRVLQQSAARSEALTHEVADLVQKVMQTKLFSGFPRAIELNITSRLVCSSKTHARSWNRKVVRIPHP